MTAPLPMTPGRRLALAVGVPLALVIIGWTGFNEVAFAAIGSYPVRLDVPLHGRTVRFSAGPANVRVTQAAGDRLRLSGKARYSIVRSSVTWHTTPSGVIMSPDCDFPAGVCDFDLQAVLPTGRPLSLSDSSGNVTLQGLSGRVQADDGSGDINGSALSGDADLQAGSGNITIDGLSGAKVTASDNSGDVALTFTKVPARVVVSAGSGNVTLVLPPGTTHYRVTANASSGSRIVGVPTSSVSRHVIDVTDQSGDINIVN